MAWWLAGVAGCINAAGFRAVGYFSSNMTGNASNFADRFALADFAQAATFAALVGTFIAGAAVSALLINIGRAQRYAIQADIVYYRRPAPTINGGIELL